MVVHDVVELNNAAPEPPGSSAEGRQRTPRGRPVHSETPLFGLTARIAGIPFRARIVPKPDPFGELGTV